MQQKQCISQENISLMKKPISTGTQKKKYQTVKVNPEASKIILAPKTEGETNSRY